MIVVCIYCLLVVLIFLLSFFLEKNLGPNKTIQFLDYQHSNVAKGVGILCVILSHVGNANGVRYMAPLGGVGVAIFLICSGYGLTESAKKQFNLIDFWKKRIVRLIIPYIITRITVLILNSSDISVDKIILDLLCIKPLYGFGWYIQYILICYLAFCIYWLLKKYFKSKTIGIFVILFCLSFFICPLELQAEQSLSFVSGVLLSEYKDSIVMKNIIKNYRFVILTTLVIGIIAFLIKQFFYIESKNIIYILQLIYKYSWAIALLFILLWLLMKYKLNIVYIIGLYSYELFLTHGYFFNLLTSVINIPVFVVVEICLSFLLFKVSNIIKNRLITR